MNFDNWDEVKKYPDCEYALETYELLRVLVSRVESLNLVGDLLWPRPFPSSFRDFPITRYDWLTLALDAFLIRYASVVDCALLLTNSIFQCKIPAKKCTVRSLSKKGVSTEVINALEAMLNDQADLRNERNLRLHEGVERSFTQDDETFRFASLFEHIQGGVRGRDRFGKRIDAARSFNEARVEIQRDFNRSTRRLVRLLDRLYDHLGDEFENRFGPLIRAATHGLNVGTRSSHLSG